MSHVCPQPSQKNHDHTSTCHELILASTFITAHMKLLFLDVLYLDRICISYQKGPKIRLIIA